MKCCKKWRFALPPRQVREKKKKRQVKSDSASVQNKKEAIPCECNEAVKAVCTVLRAEALEFETKQNGTC